MRKRFCCTCQRCIRLEVFGVPALHSAGYDASERWHAFKHGYDIGRRSPAACVARLLQRHSERSPADLLDGFLIAVQERNASPHSGRRVVA